MADGGFGLDHWTTVAAAIAHSAESLTLATADAPEWTPWRALGRLHPLLVHFPIALVLAAAAIEAWRGLRREPGRSPAVSGLLLAAALTAGAATITGWVNAAWEHGRDVSDTLLWHRWLGTGSTALLAALAVLARRSEPAHPFASLHSARRSGAFVAAITIAVVGHLGGELVHGENYVLAALRTRVREAPKDAAPRAAAVASSLPIAKSPEEVALAAAALRILDARCAECHGASKQKGGLRLSPIAAAFTGPRTQWVIQPGAPDISELLVRVSLPADDLDAMPPEGERLSDAEIGALRAWIAGGARVSSEEASTPAPVAPPVAVDRARAESGAADTSAASAAARIVERGGRALAVAQGSNDYEVDVSRAAPPWGDDDVDRLRELGAAIVELNLAGSAIGDAGVARLPAMDRLERLRLDGTRVTGAAVERLLAMPRLASANFVGTGLDDDGLVRLTAHPTLIRVYVWRTKVTADGAQRAKRIRPTLDIVGAAESAPSIAPVP